MVGMKPLIIDTREPFEYEQSHVEGAVNVSPQEFMAAELPAAFEGIAKDQEIILYCRSGMRSNTVGHMLRQQGFTNIVNGVNEHHVAKLLEER